MNNSFPARAAVARPPRGAQFFRNWLGGIGRNFDLYRNSYFASRHMRKGVFLAKHSLDFLDSGVLAGWSDWEFREYYTDLVISGAVRAPSGCQLSIVSLDFGDCDLLQTRLAWMTILPLLQMAHTPCSRVKSEVVPSAAVICAGWAVSLVSPIPWAMHLLHKARGYFPVTKLLIF